MCEATKNENSSNRIIIILNNQRKSGEFCDIKLIVDNVALFAHSAVMANFSSFIKKKCIFKEEGNENKQYFDFSFNSPLTIDVSATDKQANCIYCVNSILNFIYLNQIEIFPSHIPHLKILCEFLCIENIVPLFINNVSEPVPAVKSPPGKKTLKINSKLIGLQEKRSAKYCSNSTMFSCQKKDKTNLRIPARTSQCKLHTCLCCRYQCYKPSNLLAHLRNSKSCQMEKTCSLCFMQFDSPENVMSHLLGHDHPKPFFCTSCDQRFQSRTTLSQHIPKHSKETPFVCPQCRKGFKWKHGLTSHLIIHSKEMKHLCDECGFSTAHAKTLRAHKLVHTGDLLCCPYPGCKHKSQRKENLKSHVITHNKETPFVCEICGHKFSQSKNLQRHSRIHDPKGTHHQCPHRNCNFKSPRTDKLREHVFRQHTSDIQKSSDTQLSINIQAQLIHPQAPFVNESNKPLGQMQNNEEVTFMPLSEHFLPVSRKAQTKVSFPEKLLQNSKKQSMLENIDDVFIKNIEMFSDVPEQIVSHDGTLQSFAITDEGLLNILNAN